MMIRYANRPARATRVMALSALILGLIGTGHAMGQAETLDTDGDGLVSYTEALVAMPEMTEAEFQALDANGDGVLDAAEIAAAQEAGLIPAG